MSVADLSREFVHLKAQLLSCGVSLDEGALNAYDTSFIEKRRAYGNPDPERVRHLRIPPEMYLADSGLIVAVNVDYSSPFTLTRKGAQFVIQRDDLSSIPVTFPRRPDFYNWTLASGKRVSQVITLYGGGSLAIFANGSCSLVEMDAACHFCSIGPNRAQDNEFERIVRPTQLEEALTVALRDTSFEPQQVMLNGGNFADPDKSFLYYVRLARHAAKAISASNRQTPLHLIVFPPRDLELLTELAGLDICIAMNLEVFDPDSFSRFCPGKVKVLGQRHILDALRRTSQILGPGRTYSILVGGLEPLAGLAEGLRQVANDGITPVINVLHTDPETPLANYPRPTWKDILQMGSALQEVYRQHSSTPFYEDCGRNSIDTEAYRQMF